MTALTDPAEQPVDVVLDRPFLFRIVDDESGAVRPLLNMCRLGGPKKK